MSFVHGACRTPSQSKSIRTQIFPTQSSLMSTSTIPKISRYAPRRGILATNITISPRFFTAFSTRIFVILLTFADLSVRVNCCAKATCLCRRFASKAVLGACEISTVCLNPTLRQRPVLFGKKSFSDPANRKYINARIRIAEVEPRVDSGRRHFDGGDN